MGLGAYRNITFASDNKGLKCITKPFWENIEHKSLQFRDHGNKALYFMETP